jgi:hypothetical protein
MSSKRKVTAKISSSLTKRTEGAGFSSVVEQVFSIHEVLDSIPSIKKRKERRKKGGNTRIYCKMTGLCFP